MTDLKRQRSDVVPTTFHKEADSAGLHHTDTMLLFSWGVLSSIYNIVRDRESKDKTSTAEFIRVAFFYLHV